MTKFLYNSSQQMFYFKKNIAYTEDHIVVRKLFLHNISSELKTQQVHDYLQSFGPIERLQVFEYTKHPPHPITKSGYVHFACPFAAAQALRHRFHKMDGGQLSVQVNDSWHQPDDDGDAIETPNTDAKILMLNDHCLEHIMRQLSLIDQIRFARSCLRFRSVYESASTVFNRRRSFDDFDTMTVWDLRDFFKLSGKHLKHVEGTLPMVHCERFCEYFGTYCVNLEIMHLTDTKLILRNMQKLFKNLHSLRELDLIACDFTNSTLIALRHLMLLKKLDLSENQQFRLNGQNMNYLPESLESVNLSYCLGLCSKYLIKMCKALPMLRELNLKAITTITMCFRHLVCENSCPVLETLTISTGLLTTAENYEYVAKLPKLKKLILYIYEQGTLVRSALLTWLVEHKATQLDHLEIRGLNCLTASMLADIGNLKGLRHLVLPYNNVLGNRELELLQLPLLEFLNLRHWLNVTNDGILKLMQACPNLHVLHLEMCRLLTEKLIHDIIQKLRFQLRIKDKYRQLPLHMHVQGTKISNYSLQHADVVAKDIIIASLEPPSTNDLCEIKEDFYRDYNPSTSDEHETYFSDDELDPSNYDPYSHEAGFLSEECDCEYVVQHQCRAKPNPGPLFTD